ncbi:hypothetical protein chiPu_0013967 [Chiloscyllium punctatum]|uniref:PDZ domain-containing protein n=1 Tax=Chiloscyllium punctatum TaxID=137246 RepID=A0A401SYK1_CHIPU|nr:hypothetical protein [Chiloscyllium punctatum]
MTSVPSSKPQPLQPKQQGVTSSAPQAAKQAPAQQPAPKPEQAKSLSHSGSRKQPVLTKQQSMVASPPLKTKQPSHGPRDPQPKQQASQKPQPAKPSQQLLDQKKQQDLNKPPQQLNSTAQGAERKQPSQSPQFQQKDAKPVSQDQQLAKKQEDSFISTQQQLQKKDNSVPGTELDTGVKDQKQDVTQQKQSVQVQKPVDKTQPPSVSTAGPEVSKQPVPKGESKAAPPKEEQAKLAQKPPAAKVVPSQISATPKAQKPPEQSRRFSLNLGGSAQPPPFQPSTPPETVTGKLFGFGASLFSQASTLISAAPQQQDQHGHTAKQPPQTACKDSSVPQPSPKRDIGKKETKPSAAVDTFEQKAVGAAQTNTTDPAIIKKAAVVKESKPGAEMIKPTTKPLETGKAAPPKSTCPLCKTDLNIGSEAPPNFNTCTECKAVVCNLCGFNPMPHLTEVQEWLCLTCQTQRALSGQLGDLGKMPPPHSISSKPKQTVPAQSGPKQSQKDPSSAGSSKPSADQPTIPQTKEMQPEKVSLITTAQKDAETKEMAVKPAAKPIEAPTVVKQETSLDQDLKVTKQITKQKFATDEDQNLPPEPVAKEDAVKQVEETAAPKKLESVIEKEETAIKVMKSEEATSDSAVQKQPSEVIKVQNEQLKTPDLAQTDKEKVTMEKEEEKSDSSAIQQQRSPQGLSDTGYSSDGISSSLGEIPTLLQSEDKDLLKEPARKDSISQESSPSSPSDLAKLESTVLSILEAQANTVHHEKSGQHKDPYGPYSDHERERHRPRTLSITPESYSSDEEDLEDIQEEDEEALEDHDHEDKIASQDYNESYGSQGDEAIRRQRYDSLEDSSESEHSPCPHRQRKVSIGSSSSDSQGSGDEEDFIRKQIIEMSAEEDASGSEEDEYIRTQLKEISGKGRLESKGPTVKHKRLSKRSSSSHDDDPGRRHSWHDVDDDDDDEEVYDESPEAKYRETKSQDNEDLSLSAGGGLRRFKTIDLNSTITNKYVEDGSEIKNDRLYYEEEPELEMESLTDSPEDRSRGEGSSSLHATSSFTPGTSPTSVSSLDEDSDSSPSHKKMLGESKQQRKARHRSPGPLLPTIEDSSEEEELREEEELLREQEKQRELEQQQRKSSTKKSKKDKDELRAQRRRERPKTPPSNLSPIEDASPTEELRQAAEMEELHRSSCSEYSPSIESEPEGFEIHPEKILEVQKVYKLPTSVSLYSPTDENAGSTMHEVDAISQRSLKSAEEAYEEMMQKAKLLKNQKEPDDVFDKEPLYGGMLIEDYIYESLVEDKYNETMDNRFLNTGLETSTGLVQGSEKKLRSPDEIYEEIMQKNTNVDDAQCLHYRQPLGINLHPQDLPSSVPFAKETFVAFPLDTSEASTKIEKQLLDADAAYEELMKRQSALLTPGTSPTQPSSPDSMSAESEATSDSSLTSTAASNVVQDKPLTSMALFGTKPVQISSINGMMHAIPDVKITQHFSIEDDVDVEYGEQYYIDNRGISYETAQIVEQSKPGTTASSTASTSTVTSKAFPVAPTVTTTISSPVCSTGSVGGSRTTDFVVLSITTNVDMTDNGMDLSTFSVDGGRHALVIDSSGLRHISTIQPAIVNLSKTESDEQISVSTLAISTGSMTVVTCTGSATFTATTDTLEGPVDLGHSVSIPLPLTTKVDEATYNAARCQSPATDTIEVPINLTYSTAASISGWSSNKPVMKAPGSTTNGWTDVESTEVEAVDLSTTKPHRMMVSVDELTTGIVTTIVEEEDKPVDLTAGRRNVCCDMVYKFPFGRSCSSLTQQPASTLPEDRYGYRDDHYSYGHGATHGYRGFGSMKPSMSDTNLAEAGLFLYKSKHSFDYCNSSTDAAVDLTAGKLTTGELMDYSAVCTQPQDHLSKGTLSYPETRQVITDSGMSQYSQARVTPTIGSHYGMQSVLRSSGGVVYSSVATPIPSTFAITTQPGSIFSTSLSLHSSDTMPSLSALQHIQPVPRSSSYLTTADTGREMGLGASQGLDTSGLMSNLTTISATYHDTSSEVNFIPTETDYTQKHSIEPVAVSKLSPMTSPVSEENKHLLIEREMLEFEKMKQIRLAEELERERHEIQIFREQEKLIVQRELQELQTMKQQLLYQQEEERQAQFIIQQETIAQQQMQLEQIQQLQQQLQQQLEEQKIRQIYQYTYDPSGSSAPQTTTDQAIIESQYTTAENGQFWHAQDINTTAPAMMGQEPQPWYTAQSEGIPQHLPQPCMLSSVSEMSLKDIDAREGRVLRKRSSMPRLGGQYSDDIDGKMQDLRSYKKIVDSGVQTDDEEGTERCYTSRKRRTKKSVDSSVQTDDEDNQEDWDIPSRRRKSRIGKYADGGAEMEKAKRPHFAKLSNIAMQTVAEISVQTEPEGIIRTPSIRAQVESKIEIVKHISAPEKTYKGESLGCQTETDSDGQSPQYLTHKVITVVSPQKTDKKRPTPLEIGYSNHLRADSAFQVVPSPPKSPKVLYSPISPMTPSKETAFVPYEKSPSVDKNSQKLMALEPPKHQPLSPRTIKVIQRSMSDPKPLSPTAEENSRLHFQYNDSFLAKGSQNNTPVGTQKKVKRTLPNPPPEEAGLAGSQATFPTVNSVSHRRVCRTNTMARAKILQDIDRELELVERESSKLRKKQAELDEEEKEIDAKLRYLEMGINRRKEALLKEREKRERAYLQGVAEERDYMSDSEVSNIRETRMEAQCGLERPRTAPQPDYDQFLSPQTQSQPQYATTPSHYTQYQYPTPPLTQTQTQYQQQSPFQEQALYQQVSPYQTPATYQTVPTITYQQQPPPSQTQPTAYPHPSQMMLIQQKPRQTTVVDLEPKITTNYEVIHNQSLLMASTSADSTYVVPHLGSKYSNLDLRIGLDERGTMAGSPMSSLSAESYYADLEHRAPRNYVLIDDIGELTKGSSSLATGFNLHDIQKQVQKNERLLRTSEARRTADMKDFIGPLQSSARLHSFGKADEDTMEDPYELKLLKQQIKQEFRRGAEGLEHLSSLPQYYHADSSYRHFPKSEKYSISRLTLEKQAAKQLPPSIIYQKQSKHKKQLLDPKFSKFSPIQEARDVEPDFTNYMGTTSSVTGAPTRARLIQDDVTFSLRKNIRDQQKFLGPTVRSTFDDEIDKAYTSGSRSRPSSVYGLDLTIKRDPSSTSLRIKGQENDPLDIAYGQSSPSVRTKPSSLPISHSRGRITIVAQNSEEESPLSPVGQPMGMARAAAGPLPPISADTREQFGSSHSLPEVQQHMREESRTRGYDRDIAFIMDDFQHAMSDSEAYHLRREETDWFDKPRESRLEDAPAINRKLPEKLTHSRQSQQQSTEGGGKLVQYNFPHSRIRIQRDLKDQTVSGNGLGIRIIGGKEIPGRNGEIGAYIAKIFPGGHAEQSGKLAEGMQVLEWNGIPLTGKTYEEVQGIIGVPIGEAEICVRLDLNMLSDLESLQHLELHSQAKAGEKQKSPGVDPKQLAAELQKVSQEAPSVITSATEKGAHSHSGTTSATSSAAPSPGQPGSPAVSKKRHSSKVSRCL